MNRVPRLSIGLPVYNGAQYLSEALDALLGQSYEDFELIISDNSSSDGTEDICRRYMAQDNRIRYIRQPHNIGAAPNHNFVFREAKGELFKWASHDDLYARDLLRRCVEALDEHPHVVLSHAWTAKIDGAGDITQADIYPLATDSLYAPERFWSMLVVDGGDDIYGVVRAEILRRIAPHDSYHHADRTLVAEIGLHGPFHQVPEWLYFRRDHSTRAERAHPTKRMRCANLDPRRADPLRHPTIRLLVDYVWGFVGAIRRSPLSPADRRQCYRHLAQWLAIRAILRPIRRRSQSIHGQHTINVDRPREEVSVIPRDSVKKRTGTAPRVGFFGILGAGNVGNDGSLESMLAFIRADHHDAQLGALCGGPEQVTARYGIPAAPMRWYQSYEKTASGGTAVVLKVLGKFLDAFRTVRWVRRYDVVIVPGAGILEATLPLRPWGFPYALFLLSASARLCGTKVALVSVGADVVREPVTRWLITRAARLAHYRSYRDNHSKDAMRRMGVDTSGDDVYPDLVFALPLPTDVSVDEGTVGVGVMAYFGGNFDRERADEIYASYVDKMKRFVRWLVDNDRRVRLLIGDNVDKRVVQEILSDLRAYRPDLDPSRVGAQPVSSFADLIRQMKSVDTVVATRYHNVLCALKLSKPAVSIGYSAKSEAVMTEMGLANYCQRVPTLDVERLIEQFTELESRRDELRRTMVDKNLANARRLEQQYAHLSSTLFPTVTSVRSHRQGS